MQAGLPACSCSSNSGVANGTLCVPLTDWRFHAVAVQCICLLQGRMDAARALFHDAEKTQFVIVTIPTLMAAAESARLAKSLRQEGIPIETLIVNQVCKGLQDTQMQKQCSKWQ
jgi:anion-transporting  ArsA/GET3 family ATPase